MAMDWLFLNAEMTQIPAVSASELLFHLSDIYKKSFYSCPMNYYCENPKSSNGKLFLYKGLVAKY